MNALRKSLVTVSVTVTLGLASATASTPAGAGRLVIVGGGLRASNADVHHAFIAGLGDSGEIGIVPLASARPIESAEKFRADLIRYGVSAERIHVLPLACTDDPSTADVDESTWASNADRSEVAERIGQMSALWFTGGDQSRITQTLQPPDRDEPTAALIALRDVFARGGVIGGTSAGAAMQSEVMILGGTSPYALTQPPQTDYPGMESQENGPLVLGRGLGLFTHGTIDQHFDRKARLGRLIAALMASPESNRVGFGVDEDTALVYDAARGIAEIVGSGTVVMVDARAALAEDDQTTGIRLSVFGAGDKILLPSLAARINERRERITKPYLAVPSTEVSSLLTPYGGRLEDALGFLLVDNRSANEITTRVTTAEGHSAAIIFRADDQTEGYWGYVDGQRDSYSALRILVSCQPALGGPSPFVPQRVDY